MADDHTNLDRAKEYIAEIHSLRNVQKELKNAFLDQELDGGWRAALEHPLYLQAQASIDALQEQLRLLI